MSVLSEEVSRFLALELTEGELTVDLSSAFGIIRKIRCSGEKPCSNCVRLKKECLYLPVSATSTQPPRGKKRPRSSTEDGEGT